MEKKPLFMWAGGKRKLIKAYTPFIPVSGIKNYYELFFGGGAMFLYVYNIFGPSIKYNLNDSNEHVINIYLSIRDNLQEFLSKIETLNKRYIELPYGKRKELYYEIRNEYAWNFEKWTKPEEAATLYFLMKTGFNGIWQINKNTNGRFGTPAGLLNQKTFVYDIDNILYWNKILQGTNITSSDFRDIKIKSNSFLYLDPPYRGSFTQYGVNFDDDLQQSVLNFVGKNKNKGILLLSNRDIGDGFFEDRKKDYMKFHYFDVTYTAGRRKKEKDGTFSAKKARELLIEVSCK